MNFHSMIQTQFHTKIQILCTNTGTKYFNHSLSTYLQENDIMHQSSCVDTPQQNGVVERKNRHIIEVARALLFTSHMPSHFWGDSILTTTYLINRMPSWVISFVTFSKNSKSFFPHSRLGAHLPLRVFGSTVFVHAHAPKRNKLDPRTLKCLFIGYCSTQKGYKCYDPISQKLYVSLDVTFFKHTPYYLLQGEFVSEARPPLTLDYLNVVVFESTSCLMSTSSPNIEGHLNSGGDTEI